MQGRGRPPHRSRFLDCYGSAAVDGEDLEFDDGHSNDIAPRSSEDVAAFLMWAAEPKMMARKQAGLTGVIFLGSLVRAAVSDKQTFVGTAQKQRRLSALNVNIKRPANLVGLLRYCVGWVLTHLAEVVT